MNDAAGDPVRAPVLQDIRQLTGLRGLAALDVALTHYGMDQVRGARLFAFGNEAVDVFFCLSSFTLCLVYGAGFRPRLDLGRYAVARVARIYPLFIVTTLASLGYSLALGVPPFRQTGAWTLLQQFVRQASLLFEIPLPILGPMGSWNVPAWSISVEAFCYALAFPPLFALTARSRRLSIGRIVPLTVALAAVDFIAYQKYFTATINGPFFPQPHHGLVLWVPMIRGFAMFGAGWLMYHVYVWHKPAASFIGAITDTLAVGFLAVIASERFDLLSASSSVLIVPFLILGLMNGESVTARILASPAVHFLGVISYSLYLWHLPLQTIARHYWPWSSEASVAHSIGWPLLLALLVSVVSYHGMEMPARRAIKRRFG